MTDPNNAVGLSDSLERKRLFSQSKLSFYSITSSSGPPREKMREDMLYQDGKEAPSLRNFFL